MTTRTKTITVTAKAPDSRGTFEGVIHYGPPEGDADNERIAEWTNLPATVPLDYQHSSAGDPGGVVGDAHAIDHEDGRTMSVHGKLDLSNKLAEFVHERMLLPSDHPNVLRELSVQFSFDDRRLTVDDNGVTAIHDARLEAVGVVKRGAQQTTVSNVKMRPATYVEPLWHRLDTADPEGDLQRLKAQIDALEGKATPPPSDAVEQFIREQREVADAEKAEAERRAAKVAEINRNASLAAGSRHPRVGPDMRPVVEEKAKAVDAREETYRLPAFTTEPGVHTVEATEADPPAQVRQPESFRVELFRVEDE